MLTPAIYINGIGSIDPVGDAATSANPKLCLEPDYKQYLDSGSVRRLGKLLKRAMVAGKNCLVEAEVEVPGAIITGTGLGCLEDTERFLNTVLEDELAMLSPTAFIQSTHNTISGQIALMLKCHGYNTTYAQRSNSFENAVEDALLMLQQNEVNTILVGASDEIPANTHKILQKIGLYKSVESKKALPVAGEGTHYFLLSTEKKSSSKAKVLGVDYFPNEIDLKQTLASFLTDYSLGVSDIDLLIVGKNGHSRDDKKYDEMSDLVPQSAVAQYKHLTGEYFTASAFAWKLASESLLNGKVEDKYLLKTSTKPLKTVLLYNHFQGKEHSFALLQHV